MTANTAQQGEYYPGDTKLSQVAEDWQKSKGLVIPERGTPEYTQMYEAWVNYAFEG